MRKCILFTLIICLTIASHAQEGKKYILIKKSNSIPGDINKADIDKLDEPLKAIAAYYSSLGSSNCNHTNCELTTALGLGKQGSEAHKALLEKWFKKDKTAKQLIAQNCFQPPNTASSFSDYVSLTLERQGNTVKVNYRLFHYYHGKEFYTIGAPDIFVISKNQIEVRRLNIWKNM